jgi:ParB family transcriptional regulator, chromosome partitioning protein
LLAAPTAHAEKEEPLVAASKYGRPAVSVLSANRQRITIRFHAGSGADDKERLTLLTILLDHLKTIGKASLS